MESFIYIIVFVCAILNIILFFKVWRMTNDVHALREKYAPENKEKGKFDGVPATGYLVPIMEHLPVSFISRKPMSGFSLIVWWIKTVLSTRAST